MGRNSRIRLRDDDPGNKATAVQNRSVDVFQAVNEKLGKIAHSDKGVDQVQFANDEKIRDTHNSSNVTSFEKTMIPEEAADRNPSDVRVDNKVTQVSNEYDSREVVRESQERIIRENQRVNKQRLEREHRIREEVEKAKKESIMNSVAAQKAIYAHRKAQAMAAAQEKEHAAQQYRR